MNSKKTIVVLAIFSIILGTYVCYLDYDDQKKPLAIQKALNFNIESVQEVLLKKSDQVLLFSKIDGNWMMGGGKAEGAVQAMINELLSTFNLGIIEVVVSNPSDLAQYGLDPPEIELGIKTNKNPKFQRLLIGSNNPTNRSCYTKNKNLDNILLVGRLYKDNIDEIYAFINR
jgi:hypothetical protein